MHERGEDVFNLDEGVVRLEYPKKLSQDSLSDFEAWLMLMLRKVKRWNAEKKEEKCPN